MAAAQAGARLIDAALSTIGATAAAALLPSLGDGTHLRVYNALVVKYDGGGTRASMQVLHSLY